MNGRNKLAYSVMNETINGSNLMENGTGLKAAGPVFLEFSG